MKRTARHVAFWLVAGMVAGCTNPAPPERTPAEAPTIAPPQTQIGTIPERVAKSLLWACAPGDGDNARARDAAGDRLSRLNVLLDAADDQVLWGRYDQRHGFDLSAYTLTELNRLVWAKLYLSCFVFTESYAVRNEGGFDVVELPARFRAGLEPAEYPVPFWPAGKESTYDGTTEIVLLFSRDRLMAALYKAASAQPPHASAAWEQGGEAERARVVQFGYLFSNDNPHVRGVGETYESLRHMIRSQNCLSCHAPGNPAGASTLILLGLPSQALAARHSIPAVLRESSMPPPDPVHGKAGGVPDEQTRQSFIRLADAFEREADAALEFETTKRGGRPEAHASQESRGTPPQMAPPTTKP